MKTLVRLLISLAFVGSGVLHFLKPDSYTKIVPSYLPTPKTLVYISGVFEILGGIGLVVPKSRQFSAQGLIALLVAVFPANIYQATAKVQMDELKLMNKRGYHVVRLPMQPLLIWLVLWSSKTTKAKNAN